MVVPGTPSKCLTRLSFFALFICRRLARVSVAEDEELEVEDEAVLVVLDEPDSVLAV
jgi:hypothetical protein